MTDEASLIVRRGAWLRQAHRTPGAGRGDADAGMPHTMTDESSLIVRTRCALCWQRIQPDETRMWTCADGMLLDICEECNELLLARLISRC